MFNDIIFKGTMFLTKIKTKNALHTHTHTHTEKCYFKLWKRFLETGNVRSRPGQASSRATTVADDKCIL